MPHPVGGLGVFLGGVREQVRGADGECALSRQVMQNTLDSHTREEEAREKTDLMEPRPDSLTPIAIIIITFNEEANVGAALGSVCNWAREVYVVDSFSTDRTRQVAASYRCKFYQNRFENFSQQWNWALEHLPVESEWVFFLDADEWMPQELRDEISTLLASSPKENGFYLRWRFIWMGKWIRRGYYPKWLLRLARRGTAHWEQREINPHLMVTGATGRLQNDFIHDNQKGIADWTAKHIGYAKQEAEQLFKRGTRPEYLDANFRGSQAQRVRWLRLNVYNRLPPLLRPLLYFWYRLIVRGGMLDGWTAITYHFLHALWCPLLIDLFYLEMRANASRSIRLNGTSNSRTL
jgi:glycosyltransferase involved in cell wall biosynthesis